MFIYTSSCCRYEFFVNPSFVQTSLASKHPIVQHHGSWLSSLCFSLLSKNSDYNIYERTTRRWDSARCQYSLDEASPRIPAWRPCVRSQSIGPSPYALLILQAISHCISSTTLYCRYTSNENKLGADRPTSRLIGHLVGAMCLYKLSMSSKEDSLAIWH